MRISWIAGIIAVIIVILGVVQIVRPVPRPAIANELATQHTISGSKPSMPWPTGSVQSDAEVAGIGSWSQHGPAGSKPIGSLAKLMTVYLVLKAHPLTVGKSGPSLTVSAQDVQLYQHDASTSQSVMAVSTGEKLSEFTLLEGTLIPSGNNIATMLADWMANTPANFAKEMNQTAAQLGLAHTHYHGPVGLDPATVSTAQDQMNLAAILMKNPVFRQIVAKPQLSVPGQAHPDYNYNYLIGHQGIIGVKTGSITQSGGCVVLAKKVTVGGKTFTVYSSVLGQPAVDKSGQVWAALNAANRLLKAAANAVGSHIVIAQGQKVAEVKVPWQAAIPVVTTQPVTFLGWPGLHYTTHVSLKLPNEAVIPAGTVVGTLSANLGSQTVSVPVKTAQALTKPTLRYRLLR